MSLETLTYIFLNINSKVNIHFTQKRKVLQNIFFKSFVENSLHLIVIKILLTHILYSHTYIQKYSQYIECRCQDLCGIRIHQLFKYDYTCVCEGVIHWTNLFFVFVYLAAKASGDLSC